MAILIILACTMNPKLCFSGRKFPIVILHGISTIEVNWFDPKLLFDLPRKLFTILELSRCVLFTIFLAQLLTTLKNHFDIQIWILPTTLIFNLGSFSGKINKQKNRKDLSFGPRGSRLIAI